MTTASLGYQDIKSALMQKHIAPEHYKVNADLLAENLKQIEIFLTELQERTVKLLARVRIQMRYDKPLGTRIMFVFIHSSGKKIKQKEIDKEVKKLNKEIEETKTASQKQIEEILKKYNQTKPTDITQD